MEELIKLKSDPKILQRSDSIGNYKIRVINRGEQLFYEENGKAFICQMLILPNITLFTKSVKNWDNKEKVTEKERQTFYSRIKKYFLETDNEEISFYDK